MPLVGICIWTFEIYINRKYARYRRYYAQSFNLSAFSRQINSAFFFHLKGMKIHVKQPNQVFTLSFLSNSPYLNKIFNFNQSFLFLHNLFITKFCICYTHLKICINIEFYFVYFEYGTLVYLHGFALFLKQSTFLMKNQSSHIDMKSHILKKNNIMLKNVSNTNCQETQSSADAFFLSLFFLVRHKILFRSIPTRILFLSKTR